MKGSDYFLHVLHDNGVRYLFGNPGHTELTILDRLVDLPEMTYVLGLHEGVAMAMADGYAIASGKLGVFCGHIMPGIGNSIGMLFNAYKHGSPLLVIAGQQDQGFSLTEPFLWGDLVRQTEPFTKWAYEVRTVRELERALARAIRVATTAPTGAVFLSLPKDVIGAEADFDLTSHGATSTRICADRDSIVEAARIMAAATAPIIIAGDEVGKSGGESELETLANVTGAEVYSETASIRFNFPAGSVLYQGTLGRVQRELREVLGKADVIFTVGAEVFTLAAAGQAEPLPPAAHLVQLNLDQWQLGKNYPARPALWGDAKTTLTALVKAVRELQDPPAKAAARERARQLAQRKAGHLQSLSGFLARANSQRPMAGITAMDRIVRHAPGDAVIVDESATTGIALRRLLMGRPLEYFGLKAGGLGWGLPASIGVALALPDRPVICVVGDGAALFSIQSLWTAAHHHCRIAFVICNNAQYRLIKHRLHLFGGGASARAKRYIGSDIADPAVDFVALAQGMGVRGARVEIPEEIGDAIDFALSADGPGLVELKVEGSFPERE
jgi:benzoylformate decarboxylase